LYVNKINTPFLWECFGIGTLKIIPISTFILGVWQVYRWRWKLGIIADMEAKVMAEAVYLPMDKYV